MKEAVAFVQDGNSLRRAARLYNVPVETLRRRVNGMVTLDCKPGPSTILTREEEQCLVGYVIEMADRGFGLQSEDLMQTAYTIMERSGRSNPFSNGMAGKGWLEAFILNYLFGLHKLSRTRELPVQVSRRLMIFLQNWAAFTGD